LWHGANWTFVVWGGLHGCWLAVERFFAEDLKTPIPSKLGTAASRLITLTVVLIAWIFFRATTLKQALSMVGALGDFTWNANFAPVLVFLAVLGGIVVAMDLLLEQEDDEYLFQRQPISAPVLAAGLLLATALFGALNSNAFIYFQF
jgi:alginate O-acetyltransferase complex protein AlgI